MQWCAPWQRRQPEYWPGQQHPQLRWRRQHEPQWRPGWLPGWQPVQRRLLWQLLRHYLLTTQHHKQRGSWACAMGASFIACATSNPLPAIATSRMPASIARPYLGHASRACQWGNGICNCGTANAAMTAYEITRRVCSHRQAAGSWPRPFFERVPTVMGLALPSLLAVNTEMWWIYAAL